MTWVCAICSPLPSSTTSETWYSPSAGKSYSKPSQRVSTPASAPSIRQVYVTGDPVEPHASNRTRQASG